MREARLHAVKTDILASLSQPGLTLAEIAVRHALSPRYVQMLFESEGLTFSRFLLDQRLKHAHRMLRDPVLPAAPSARSPMPRLRRSLPFQPRLPPPLRGESVGRAGSGEGTAEARDMDEPATDISTFRFSTDDLPERDGVPMMRGAG